MATAEENRKALQEIADSGLQDQLNPEIRGRFDKLVEMGVLTLATSDPEQAQTAAPENIDAQPAPNPRARRARALQKEATDNQDLVKSFEAGDISSQDLTEREVDAIQRARIDAIPELTGNIRGLSDNIGFKDALMQMVTFDPAEMGQILHDTDENIGIVMTPEGEHIAVNNSTGATFSINKIGPSLIDAVQLTSSALAFTPAGRLPGLVRPAAAASATQSAIEGGQALSGGEFNTSDVALAGAAVPVAAAGIKGAVEGVSKLRKTFNISTPSLPTRKATPWFGQESKNTQIIREALQSGEGDKVAAGYMIDGARKVVSDPVARQVIKQGTATGTFDPGKVSLFSGSSKLDKKAFGEMLDVVQSGLTNAKKAALHRPGRVVGDTLMKRYKFVQDLNSKAGKAVGKAAKDLKGADVDTSVARIGFLDDLEKQGIGIADDGSLDFTLSAFEDIPGAQNLMNTIWKRLKVLDKSRDGLNIHRFKKFIDNQIDIGKRGNNPIVADAERVALGVRQNVNTALQEASPAYREANKIFSETIDPLKEFQRISGKNFDPESSNANEFAGKIARRMLSNVQSREPLIDTIHAMEQIAVNNGAKFNDDIATQIMFVEQLEQAFGTFAPTGIQGEISKGVGRAIRGDKAGVVADAAVGVISKARRINEQNAMKSLRKFVDQK